MKKLLLILSLLQCLNSYSQPRSHTLGIINPDELELKECPFEKDAAAVVLFDYGESSLLDDKGFIIYMKRHKRIKLFNEGGYDQGTIVIPLHISGNDREKVKDIKGFTCNMVDGTLVKTPLDVSQVYEEKVSEYLYLVKFAMPQIKDGSIIEYSYSMTSPFLVNFVDWEFQSDIPTMYSQFSTAMVPFYSYRYRIQGTSRLDYTKTYESKGIDRHFAGIIFKEMVYEFGLKDIPSLESESFISSRKDYVIKLDFQLVEINNLNGSKIKYMDTWPGLANELLDNPDFGSYLKKTEKWAAKEANSYSGLPEKERAAAILNRVKSSYKWNGYYGKTAYESLKDMEKSLQGNAGNLNLTAIAIMRANGLEAKPVIISTRQHGKVFEDFPYNDFFNYVLILTRVDGQYQVMDATSGFCPANLIPPYCINGKGFIVEKDSEAWINITNNAPSVDETNLQITVNAGEHRIEGQCSRSSTGYIALDQRQDYFKDADAFKKSYKSLGIDEQKELTVSALMEEDQPFEFSFDFSQDVDVIGQQIILNPFANFPIKDNPFKQEKRSLPVDLLNKKTHRYKVELTIPEGYKVEVLPSPRTMANDDVEFNYMVQQTGNNKLKLFAMYNFKKAIYPAKSYGQLKHFMNEVTKVLNAKIVLVKDEDLTMK